VVFIGENQSFDANSRPNFADGDSFDRLQIEAPEENLAES